jgi:hypothetical protein
LGSRTAVASALMRYVTNGQIRQFPREFKKKSVDKGFLKKILSSERKYGLPSTVFDAIQDEWQRLFAAVE